MVILLATGPYQVLHTQQKHLAGSQTTHVAESG